MSQTSPHAETVAARLSLPVAQVAAAAALLGDGNTVPFIARYRKEATRGLDEEQLRRIAADLALQQALAERRATVLATIDAQGQLTDELRARIEAAESRTELEDLYQPYRPKRRTRASVARERGLEPLARMILDQAVGGASAVDLARPFVSDDVPTAQDALAGARDIVAEIVADHPDVRRAVRSNALAHGVLHAQRAKEGQDPKSVYRLYYDFGSRVDRIQPHQVLAMNRGEREGVLRVRLDVARRDSLPPIDRAFRANRRSPFARELAAAALDGAERLLLPAIERDVRRSLTEAAERHAIAVFAENLRGLLTAPPLSGHTVLGIDPGFRTGCKVAVVDPTGKLLGFEAVFPHPPQGRHEEAAAALARLCERHGVTLIAIGNGTASRETEALVAELVRDRPDLRYLIASEAGASVYSASPIARSELPDLDVSVRGAVSIARRVQDPLAELVKIEPKAVGVGLYQHDVDQPALARALDDVVESVVSSVGVEVNTASAALLRRVPGIGPKLAEAIVAHREARGPFADRASVRDVRGLGPRAFEQAAGFLRVRDGREPLDAGAIHPESYGAARALLRLTGLPPDGPPEARAAPLGRLVEERGLDLLAHDIGCGVPTLTDILDQLVRPGRDPRDEVPAPLLRQDILKVEDLREGMALTGTVRNVVDFGAFVDIGVKHDGLLHRSRVPRGHRLHVGDVVDVTVVSLEPERGRIGLALAEG